MMILPEAAFQACDAVSRARTGEYEMEDVVSWLIEQGYQFQAIPFRGWRRNINTLADLRDASERIG